jgi:hypothetical protein
VVGFSCNALSQVKLEDAVLFWGLLAVAVAAVVLLAGLLRWALTDPDADRDAARDRFQAEQDWRALRRSGKL